MIRIVKSWDHYSPLCDIDKWGRRKLRSDFWKQWGRAGYRELPNRGLSIRASGRNWLHRIAGYVTRASGTVGRGGREAFSCPDWAF